jgi:hypothetical protein
LGLKFSIEMLGYELNAKMIVSRKKLLKIKFELNYSKIIKQNHREKNQDLVKMETLSQNKVRI